MLYGHRDLFHLWEFVEFIVEKKIRKQTLSASQSERATMMLMQRCRPVNDGPKSPSGVMLRSISCKYHRISRLVRCEIVCMSMSLAPIIRGFE